MSDRDGVPILDALRLLDRLIEPLVNAQGEQAAEPSSSLLQGLRITLDQANSYLQAAEQNENNQDRTAYDDLIAQLEAYREFNWVADRYGLGAFDQAALLLALTPEVDLRYERIFAFIQDDVTRKLPTVETALRLFGTDFEDRMGRRAHFASDAPLIRHQLIELSDGPYQADAPLLAKGLRINGMIRDTLLGAIPPSDRERAAQAHLHSDLDKLARRIEPIYGWTDIVLPENSFEQLRELGARVTHRDRVFHEWGFDQRLATGRGVSALFFGPAGTGKTMAATIIARELGLDLYQIDLAGIVSKYIGETEKNLDCVFTAAEHSGAVLFFDEADALFGKRSEIRDSHDRYANLEISYLLQKMDQYEGIAILASNLRQNLDEAFVRRLAFLIHFPFPNREDRLRIWQGIWPKQSLLAEDVDLPYMARQFKLSGGSIRNIALAAAFRAAGYERMITQADLLHGTRREYRKIGKTLSAIELLGAEAGA